MSETDLFQRVFPNLISCDWKITSDKTRRYNCIAWSVGLTHRWLWPSITSDWPDSVPRVRTIEAFIAMLATFGFEPCEQGDLETDIEKVALYAIGELPTHAARQLPSGAWTSKLGRDYDIEHTTPEGVESALYGSVVKYFKRPRPPA